jgi:cobalt-precorrin 5A hydrolase
MYTHGIAIIAITSRGVETALKIKKALGSLELPCKVYAPKKYMQNDVIAIKQKLDEFIKETYSEVDAIVAVMATGIIIRAVAPYLQGKLVDPAVIDVDVSGKFVISLLSGHYGGANELTRLISEGIGATAVITTASDSLGKQSVDELARILHLSIENPESLVAVNTVLVNGEQVALILVGEVKIPTSIFHGYIIENVEDFEQAIIIASQYSAAAIVTKEFSSIENTGKPITIMKPKRIIMGIGARKEITQNQILEAAHTALAQINLPLERIDGLATVDIKKNSQSMLSAAETLGLKFEFVSVEELRVFEHEDLSPDSEIVKKKIGVGGVCERAALLKAGKNPHLILKKQKLNGVTVAIAEGE